MLYKLSKIIYRKPGAKNFPYLQQVSAVNFEQSQSGDGADLRSAFASPATNF